VFFKHPVFINIRGIFEVFKMNLKVINEDFSICKVQSLSDIDFKSNYLFIGKTDEEISVVCPSLCTPKNTLECDQGWKAFRIEGILDFSLIGILSKITSILAENKIGIFAVSTYNTDYVLTKEKDFKKAISLLENSGYKII
jgi:hypothetical protein